jgi:hypothetical protein
MENILEEYIFNRGLPDCFKNKAVIVKKEAPTTYAWKYEDVKNLFYWLITEEYIVRTIHVFEVINKTPRYFNQSWYYYGERNLDYENNKRLNRSKALEFIENVQVNNTQGLIYEVFFEPSVNWDKIRIEFFNRAILHGGELLYTSEDSLNIIERCRQLNKKIIAIDAFMIRDKFIQPQDYYYFSTQAYGEFDPEEYFKKYHVKKNSDSGHWEESLQYIKDNFNKNWVFEIDYEE